MPQSQVLISPEGEPVRIIRVRAEALSNAGVELEVPAGLKGYLQGAALFLRSADSTLRVAGPATLRLSNGIRMLVRNARLTLIERQPSGDRRIVVEPFVPLPQRE
jgi:hypothetical protein